MRIPSANSAKNMMPNAKLNTSNRFVFSLSAPTQPQKPITNTNEPTTFKKDNVNKKFKYG